VYILEKVTKSASQGREERYAAKDVTIFAHQHTIVSELAKITYVQFVN